MVLDVDNFSLEMNYDKNKDQLNLTTDRELKNSDILLILINILTTVEKSYRNDILDLALAVIDQRATEKLAAEQVN